MDRLVEDATRILSEAATKITKIVSMDWLEPSEGHETEVWSLTAAEWKEVDAVIKFENAEQGDNVGDTFVKFTFKSTKATGADRDSIEDVMDTLGVNIRYSTGEDLYDKDCPVLKKYKIER